MSRKIDARPAVSAPILTSAMRKREENSAYRQVEGTPTQIRREIAAEFDFIEGNIDLPHVVAEAETTSRDLLQAGLKDTTRASIRRTRGILGEKGKVARVDLKYGAKLVATGDMPVGTAVKLGVEEKVVPLMLGQERAIVETERIKRSRRKIGLNEIAARSGRVIESDVKSDLGTGENPIIVEEINKQIEDMWAAYERDEVVEGETRDPLGKVNKTYVLYDSGVHGSERPSREIDVDAVDIARAKELITHADMAVVDPSAHADLQDIIADLTSDY